MIIGYIIYKLFILENDVYYLNQKINKLEIEFSNPNELISEGACNNGINGNNGMNETNENQENFNMSDIIMNEIFNSEGSNTTCNINSSYCKVEKPQKNEMKNEMKNDVEISDDNAIDIDNILNDVCNVVTDNDELPEKKEVIFDLKKEIINDDKESVISSNAVTKKKLQKLNLDKLKDKCTELNISADGTKSQIIDRIIEISYKEVE